MSDDTGFEALHLRDRLWAVRPKGACGTCGWVNGKAWAVMYVSANNAVEAVGLAIWRGTPFHAECGRS